MVVQGHITHERLLQIFTAGELVSFEHIGNTPIEALHHAIRYGRAWLGQAVLNAQGRHSWSNSWLPVAWRSWLTCPLPAVPT